MEITSARNPLLQSIRKAVSTGRPTEEGYLVAEGPHLVEEALRSSWRVAQIVTTTAGKLKHADLIRSANVETVTAASRPFESASDTRHSQQILALVEPKKWTWQDLMPENALILALDAIQDPGNAGTMVRSAEAFGATGLLFLMGSAHVANGKLLRSSAGSIFRVPFLESVKLADLLARADGLNLFALDANGPVPLPEARFQQPSVLIAGNEGSGVRPELLSKATRLSIPTRRVESLNAAVACSLALYAASQQRTSR